MVTLKDYENLGYHQLLANSFLISADMGHAVSDKCPHSPPPCNSSLFANSLGSAAADQQFHPNYESRYEPNLAPRMNQGVVIKTNANQRYTSTAQTTFLVRRVAKKAGVPLQEFEIRNDSVSWISRTNPMP